jgi:hypothetical protein
MCHLDAGPGSRLVYVIVAAAAAPLSRGHANRGAAAAVLLTYFKNAAG